MHMKQAQPQKLLWSTALRSLWRRGKAQDGVHTACKGPDEGGELWAGCPGFEWP